MQLAGFVVERLSGSTQLADIAVCHLARRSLNRADLLLLYSSWTFIATAFTLDQLVHLVISYNLPPALPMSDTATARISMTI